MNWNFGFLTILSVFRTATVSILCFFWPNQSPLRSSPSTGRQQTYHALFHALSPNRTASLDTCGEQTIAIRQSFSLNHLEFVVSITFRTKFFQKIVGVKGNSAGTKRRKTARRGRIPLANGASFYIFAIVVMMFELTPSRSENAKKS